MQHHHNHFSKCVCTFALHWLLLFCHDIFIWYLFQQNTSSYKAHLQAFSAKNLFLTSKILITGTCDANLPFPGMTSNYYQEFRKHCYTAFLHLRRHANLILNLFSLMTDASVPDIALEPDKTVKKVWCFVMLIFCLLIGCCYYCFPDPFRRIGTWRKTMEPRKPNYSPDLWPEVAESQRVAKEQMAQSVPSWTVQNEMRGVLCRMTAGAACRIFDFANSWKKEFNRSLCPLQRRLERTQRAWRGSTSSSVDTEGICVLKDLDKTVRLETKRRLNNRGKRRKTTKDCRRREQRTLPGQLHQPRRFQGEMIVRRPIVAW